MSRGTLNKVFLIGRLGKDPDLRYSTSGTAIASFSLATNHGQKNEQGSWEDATEWHNVKAFGKNADFSGEYLKKGTLIFVEGRLQTSNWEDQKGQKHYRTEIIISSIQLLGSKNENGKKIDQNDKAKVSDIAKNEENDDLPF
jgi:single-strand DNA-binding protein